MTVKCILSGAKMGRMAPLILHPNAVIAVTHVTNQNLAKVIDYNIITNLPNNLYSLYDRWDKRACYNCNDKEDK